MASASRTVVIRRRRKAREREGAVMLVVLLILLVATASAAVSVSNTQTELQSAGNERVAVQTRYVAEAATVSTLAWMNRIQDRFACVLRPAVGDEMKFYAEPEVAPGKDYGQATIENVAREQTGTEVAPLNDAAPYVHSAGSGGTVSAGAGGSGGAAGAGPVSDTTGSFGPEQSFALTSRAYLVQMTDCVRAQGAMTPGEAMDGDDGDDSPFAYHCTLTARGRLEPVGATVADVDAWTFGLGGKEYEQRKFASAHDARATIITPSVMPCSQ